MNTFRINQVKMWTEVQPIKLYYKQRKLIIMKNEKRNEELQSRRDFFKKTVKMALPIIGAIVLANTPDVLKASEKAPMGCSDDGCSYTCNLSCQGDCSGSCRYGCSTTCKGTCSGSCKYSCSYSNK